MPAGQEPWEQHSCCLLQDCCKTQLPLVPVCCLTIKRAPNVFVLPCACCDAVHKHPKLVFDQLRNAADAAHAAAAVSHACTVAAGTADAAVACKYKHNDLNRW